MQCRYCGKPLGLLRKLADQEFCSAAHQKAYAQEQEALVLTRLLEARPSAVAVADPPPNNFVSTSEEDYAAPPPDEFLAHAQEFSADDDEFLAGPPDEAFELIPERQEFAFDLGDLEPIEAGFLLEEPYLAVPDGHVRNGVVPVHASEFSVPMFPVFVLSDPEMANFVAKAIPSDCALPWHRIDLEIEPASMAPAIPASGLAVFVEPYKSDPSQAPYVKLPAASLPSSQTGSFAVPERIYRQLVPANTARPGVTASLPVCAMRTAAPPLFAMDSQSAEAVLAPKAALPFIDPRNALPFQLRNSYVTASLYAPLQPFRPVAQRLAPAQPNAVPECDRSDLPESFETAGPRLTQRMFSDALCPEARTEGGTTNGFHTLPPAPVATTARPSKRGSGGSRGSSRSRGRRAAAAAPAQEAATAVAYAYEPVEEITAPAAFAVALRIPCIGFADSVWALDSVCLQAGPLVPAAEFHAAPIPVASAAAPALEPEYAASRPEPAIAEATLPELSLAMAQPLSLPVEIGVADSHSELASHLAFEHSSASLAYPQLDEEMLAPAPRLAEPGELVARMAPGNLAAIPAAPAPLLTLGAITAPEDEWIPDLHETLQPLTLAVRSSEPGFVRTALPAELSLDHFAVPAPRRDPIHQHSTPTPAARLAYVRQPAKVEMTMVDFESLPAHLPIHAFES